MTPPKTQEELDKEEREKHTGFAWVWDKITGMFGSFGSILWTGLLIFGGYMLLKNEHAKEWIGKILDGIPAIAGLFGEKARDWTQGWMDKAKVWIGCPGALTKMLDNMTDEQARTELPKNGVPQAIADIIAKDPQSWAAFRKAVGTLNGTDDLTGESTIMGLITQQPNMAAAILKAMKGSGAAATTKEQETIDKLTASMKAIIAGPKLQELFNNNNRQATLTMMTQLSSKLGKTWQEAETYLGPNGLQWIDANGKILDTGKDKDGKPTQKLRTEFAKSIDDQLKAPPTDDKSDAGKGNEGSNPDKSKPTEEKKSESKDNNTPSSEEIKANADTAKEVLNSGNSTRISNTVKMSEDKLAEKVGQANVALFRTAVTDSCILNYVAAGMTDEFWMQLDNLKRFKKFADDPKLDLNGMPKEMQDKVRMLRRVHDVAPIAAIAKNEDPALLTDIFVQPGKATPDASFVFDNLLYADSRAKIEKAGTTNVAHLLLASLPDDASSTQRTLLADDNFKTIMAVAKQIGEPKGSTKELTIRHEVIKAIIDFETDTNKDLLTIPAADLAAFFSKKGNIEAIHQLLGGLHGFTDKHDAYMLKNMQNHWGNAEKGIGAAMSDADGAKKIQAVMAGETLPEMGTIAGAKYLLDHPKVAKSKGDLEAFQDAMKKAPPPTAKTHTR